MFFFDFRYLKVRILIKINFSYQNLTYFREFLLDVVFLFVFAIKFAVAAFLPSKNYYFDQNRIFREFNVASANDAIFNDIKGKFTEISIFVPKC